MKRYFHLFCSGLTFFFLMSCSSPENKTASFRFFSYAGEDSMHNTPIDLQNQYLNPILGGFYPDPSICRKGEDFFLVNSSFSFYPGIPIFTSKDLVNWTQIGNVLNRPSQLNLENGIRISGGIYAPAIKYNKYNDTFYLITTCVDGIGNFVVKTKDPYQGWSDPILLPSVGGIDPSLFFDDDGNAYVVHNDAPEGEPQWDGHRAIWIHSYDTETDQTFGTPRVIVDGGTDISKHPIWIEGPHIYKRNGKYLLICAEGGTSQQHSEVAFTSDHIYGPYIPSEYNPILTQRDLPEDRLNKVTSTGHADIVEDIDGKTWAVFLGCRPYEGNHYNTGRETFLLPVEWENDIPIILPHEENVPIIVSKENLENKHRMFGGNFSWQDNFDEDSLDARWLMIRTPKKKWYNLKENRLELSLLPVDINDKGQPAFLGVRQQHIVFEITTELDFTPGSDQDVAGLACFQKEGYNIVFGKTLQNGKQILFIDRAENEIKRIATLEISNAYVNSPIQLKISGNGKNYNFYASFSGKKWQPVLENVDARNLSTESAGGFNGTIIGLYAGTKK
jgi:Beta-xylosidase